MRLSTSLSLLLYCGTLSLAARTASAQDATVPVDFASIGAALASATDTDGDGTLEIFVQSGTYNENVRVSRSNVLIEGDAASRPTIQGDGTAHVVYVETLTTGFLTNVSLRNLLVTGGGALHDGIELSRVDNATVENVEAFGNAEGIRWSRGSGGAVRTSLVRDNAQEGIKLSGVVNASVAGNTARNNASNGIDVTSCAMIVIENNDAHHNLDNGLRVRRGPDFTVRNNMLHDNMSNGGRFESVTRLAFTGNSCSVNANNGIRTRNTFDCLWSQNQLVNNQQYGVRRRTGINDDFDASLPGAQEPVGDNVFTGNQQGEVRND